MLSSIVFRIFPAVINITRYGPKCSAVSSVMRMMANMDNKENLLGGGGSGKIRDIMEVYSSGVSGAV